MKSNWYKAFGLRIESEFPIAQLPQAEPGEADVRILHADLSGLTDAQRKYPTANSVFFRGYDQGCNFVTDGRMIQVDPFENYSESKMGLYLMGSGMGAILIQRGFMLLHGSCVTDGKNTILITGDSGAGKSTTAAEFLKRGWKLVTDDVTCIFDQDGVPMVQSSYPSQKLWQDAMDCYDVEQDDVHSLYFSQDREKFGVNVTQHFYEGVCPLTMVVRLVAGDEPCSISAIEGITKADQLLRNSYRSNFIAMENRQRHFQRCVTMSTKIPMALAVRENGKQCADTVYDLIIKHLEEQRHD
ncbi:MAG: hypothetical protein IJA49_08340 [Oscillospiraceae bacterium]|nr:hypothetical protein [Oscillospiraceae bacterium]